MNPSTADIVSEIILNNQKSMPKEIRPGVFEYFFISLITPDHEYGLFEFVWHSDRKFETTFRNVEVNAIITNCTFLH
jgi:hypothetical protein